MVNGPDMLLVTATGVYPVLFIVCATGFSPGRCNILFTEPVSKRSIELATIPPAVNGYVHITVLRIPTKLLCIKDVANSKFKSCLFVEQLLDNSRINGAHVISDQ